MSRIGPTSGPAHIIPASSIWQPSTGQEVLRTREKIASAGRDRCVNTFTRGDCKWREPSFTSRLKGSHPHSNPLPAATPTTHQFAAGLAGAIELAFRFSGRSHSPSRAAFDGTEI